MSRDDQITVPNNAIVTSARALIEMACSIVPAAHRDRYRTEWNAEAVFVAQTAGALPAMVFATNVLVNSFRTTLALREGSTLAFQEASLAALALAIPTAFFAVFGLAQNEPLVLLSQGGLALGLLAASIGVWRDERGIFMSRTSQVGLIVAVISAVAITLVNRLTEVDNPALEGPYKVLIPSIVAQVGLLVLFLSSRVGRFRSFALRAGLALTTVGPAGWVLVGIVNTVLVPDWGDKFFHFVSVPPMIAVAYASYAVLSRPEVVGVQTS